MTSKKVHLSFPEDDELLEYLEASREVDHNGITIRLSLADVVKGCIRSVKNSSD